MTRNGFKLGEWDVWPLEGRMQRGDESRRVRPRAMDVLCRLVDAGGEVVERDTLLGDVWGRTAVSDEPLTATVGELRRALGDRRGAIRYIETIPKRGYRLLETAVPLVGDGNATFASPATTAPARPTPYLKSLKISAAGVVVLAVAALLISQFPGDEPVTPTSPPRSVAVLPFADMTPDKDQAWFGDGMADEVLNLLARVPALRVAARTSSFSFRGRSLPIGEIARQLNVSHVLEGSVRRSGDRVRVTAQLIAAEDGFHVWSETFDREIDDIFAIQDDIAASIAEAMQVSMLGNPPEAVTTSPEAYTLFLQANYLAKQGARDGMREATGLYLQALEIDPAYPPAWSELASVYVNQASNGFIDYDSGFEKSRDAATQAVTIDPGYAPAYGELAWVAMWYDGDMAEAARHLETAMRLAPRDPVLLGGAAVLVMALGRIEQAIVLHEFSFARSPVDPIAAYNLALSYKYADRLDDAEATFRKLLQLSPEYASVRYHYGETLLLAGRTDEARAVFDSEPDDAYRVKGQALAHHALGNPEVANAKLAELTDKFGVQWPSEVAHVHAWRNEKDLAFEWLEREFATYGKGGWGEWKLQPLYANLHDDPRWDAFLLRAGADDATLATIAFDVVMPD